MLISYIEHFYSEAEADRLFDYLKSRPAARPKNPRNSNSFLRKVGYGTWSPLPREPYRLQYSGETLPFAEAPDEIKQLSDRLSAYAGKSVNYIATLGYENEKDHIGWHNHREDFVREDQSVWVLSLGVIRVLGIRPIGCKDRTQWELYRPKHGSLYVLPSSFNKTHEHAILDNPYPCGLRISINCKHIPAVMGPQVRHGSQEEYPDAVYVGRKNRRGKIKYPDTPFGNYSNPRTKTAAEFREYAIKKMLGADFRAQVESLRGKDLLCPWCKPDDPDCHARVWLESQIRRITVRRDPSKPPWRTRMKLEAKTVNISDIKMRKDAFISGRKVARFAAEINGLPGMEETPAERSTSIMFLASLLVNVTVMQRMATERAVDAGTAALSTRSVRGINEVIHYMAENLRYRVAAGTPYVWSLDDCLEDYVEVAEHYGVTSILQAARN